jgi:very-short-patch-repair endonuclease
MIRQRTSVAQRLRRNMTETEQLLWRALRELKGPNRFRRQHPIGRYIVDFACPAARLAIEIDGGQHAVMREADDTRSSEIADHGYRVIRFWNGDVMENLDGVLQIICEQLRLVPSILPKDPPHPPRR